MALLFLTDLMAPLFALLGFAAAYAPAVRPLVASAASRVRVVSATDNGSLLQAMSDSFYANKRARLEAELASRLSELEEFEARERALLDMSQPAVGPATGTASLIAQLEAEKAKSAALEAELARSKLDSEIALQKVAAYWCARVQLQPLHAAIPR